MHAATRQAFDISIGTGLERLELVPGDFAVHAREAGARLDLGGIGKGFAVDRMAESLREWDVRHALSSTGASARCWRADAPPGRDGLAADAQRAGGRRRAGPSLGAPAGAQRVGHAARATTSWIRGPVGPRAGRRRGWPSPPTPRGSSRPERSPATVAEALSTAFMLLPVEEIEDLGRQCPGLETWLTLEPTDEGKPGAVRRPSPGDDALDQMALVTGAEERIIPE